MGRKWKQLTKIGLMSGAEIGADFFKPWRAEKARQDLIASGADFMLFLGGLLNMEDINMKIADRIATMKKRKKGYKFSHEERVKFCMPLIKQILEDVFPPLKDSEGNELIKYWVFPSPLFELKKDKYHIAEYIYESLERESAKRTKGDPYIRVGSDKELIEIEDDVAVKTLGVILPTSSFFRAKTLSTPIEREITYQQLSSIARSVPDLYIAGAFGASISEVNPVSLQLPRPYVSIPSLSIKLTETVLQNTLGYALLTLFHAEKNHPQFETCFTLFNDAIELECMHAQREFRNLKSDAEKRVASAIVDKIRIGTKVTIGKIEAATGLPREKVVKTLQALRRRRIKINLELGEIRNPYRIIPNTRKDLTELREGELIERTSLDNACVHIPDTSVDYDFLEHDIPRLLAEEGVNTWYIVGDVSEGNKYDQDRKGEVLDRIYVPQDQKKAAGWIIAYGTARAFKARLEKFQDWRMALPRVVTIPGNHDEVRNEPPLKSYAEILKPVLTRLIHRHLKETKADQNISYEDVEAVVREKILILDNPALDDGTGLVHEYSGRNKVSTSKMQDASKQFMVMSDARRVKMANHHEQNFTILRVGNKTIVLTHIGTLKRFYGYESKRSKISEFGVAVVRDVWKNGQLVKASIKFIPSTIDFEMKDGKAHQEKNRIRGIDYYNVLERYERDGELPPIN